MTKYKAIPNGYMTVGELAKKMNTTVRALQYYDREGVLSPSGTSEGGRRLYTSKDVVALHQILSLKSLGFSLADIKERLIALETPDDVAQALDEQAKSIRAQIASLTETLDMVEKLREETLGMQNVDFAKYAAIVANLQMKNEFYGLIKHFDDNTLGHLQRRFDMDSGKAVLNTLNRLINEMESLQQSGAAPEGAKGQAVAEQWWGMVEEFTGGDMSLLPDLLKMSDYAGSGGGYWSKRWQTIEPFLTAALGEYFAKAGYDPLEQNGKD